MPVGREDEPALPAEQLGAAVAGLPRADVVGDPRGDVGVDGHRGQVHRGAEHRRLARLRQRVADRDVDEVAVQRRAHPGRVGVPEQDVEVRRLLALQVVVDPVVPHQVVGPQPGEDLRQPGAVQVALLARLLGRGLDRLLVHERGDRAGPRPVQDGDGEAERRHPVQAAGRGEVGQQHRRDDPAGAEGLERDLLLPGDALDGVHRVEDRPGRRRPCPSRRAARPGCATTS